MELPHRGNSRPGKDQNDQGNDVEWIAQFHVWCRLESTFRPTFREFHFAWKTVWCFVTNAPNEENKQIRGFYQDSTAIAMSKTLTFYPIAVSPDFGPPDQNPLLAGV